MRPMTAAVSEPFRNTVVSREQPIIDLSCSIGIDRIPAEWGSKRVCRDARNLGCSSFVAPGDVPCRPTGSTALHQYEHRLSSSERQRPRMTFKHSDRGKSHEHYHRWKRADVLVLKCVSTPGPCMSYLLESHILPPSRLFDLSRQHFLRRFEGGVLAVKNCFRAVVSNIDPRIPSMTGPKTSGREGFGCRGFVAIRQPFVLLVFVRRIAFFFSYGPHALWVP